MLSISGMTILVVEDDEGDLHITKRMLERLDVSDVLIASSIEEARAIVDRKHVDGVLLDWNLPDGFGSAFLEAIGVDVPVVLLIGDCHQITPVDAFSLGALDYIDKNELSPALLGQALRHAVIRHKQTNRRNVHDAERFAALGGIASGVAHEINNPLAWLTSNMEFLNDMFGVADVAPDALRIFSAGESEEMLEVLLECREAMARIKDTSRVLHELADFEEGGRKPLDLNTLVAIAIENDHRLARSASVKVQSAPGSLMFQGNKGLVLQALSCVLLNAVEAIERARPAREHELVISTHDEGAHISVRISDTGDGIPQAVRGRLFQPFVSHDPKRNGMGLAFVARAIELHGGEVEALDTEVGACIRMTLPRHENAAYHERARHEREEQVFDLRILIIDNHPHMTKLFRLLAGTYGQFVRVDGLNESLQRIEHDTAFDGVFVNVSMAEFQQNGMEWYQRFASVMPDAARRLVICSIGERLHRLEGFFTGTGAVFFTGPFDFTGLSPLIWHWKKSLE